MKATFTPSGSARWLPIFLLLSWLGSSEAGAQLLYASNSPAPAQSIVEADFNSDGKPDLATARSGVGQTSTFASKQLFVYGLPDLDVTLTATPSATLVCTQTSLTLSVPLDERIVTSYAFSGPGIVSTTGNTAVVNKTGVYSVTVTYINGQTASSQITVDASNTGTPAVRTINRKTPAKELTTAAPVTYEVTFSDNVTGVDASDFTLIKTGTLTGGTVGAVSGSGSTYQVVVSGLAGDGALRLDLNDTGTGIRDGCNNDIGSGYTSGQTYTIDDTPPTITSITIIPNYIVMGGGTRDIPLGPGFYISFSERVEGADYNPGFALTRDSDVFANLYLFFLDPLRPFEYQIGRYYIQLVDINGGQGTLGLNFKAAGSGITDLAGNPIVTDFTSSERFDVDKVPPYVESIKRQAPVAAVTGPGSLTFRVTFSEAVTGVDATDFKVVATGTVAGYSIGAISAISATETDVTVSGITGEGTLELQVYRGYNIDQLYSNIYNGNLEKLKRDWIILYGGIATIYDLGGNPLDFFSDFIYGEQYTISNAPVVASINPTTAQLSCANPTVRLTASTGSAYLWSTGATMAAIDVTTPGTYSVTVTNNNVTSVASAEVTGSTQPPTASINPGSATLNCANPTVSLTASGGESYRWDDNSTNAIRSVSTGGTYSVTVTAANGCTASAQITVTGSAADGLTTYYADADGDGFGNPNPNSTTRVCSSTPPAGYVTTSTDCDDTRKLYADGDGDGFGAGAAVACGVATNTDCDDRNAAIHPNAPEVCDGQDNDCDGAVDEDVKLTFYADGDGDGFGNATQTTQACSAPAGYVTNATDCDDTQRLYGDGDGDGFGAGAAVACGVATNTDCDDTRTLYADADGDGFGSTIKVACGVANNTDCDDSKVMYADADGDGFGSSTKVACNGVANNTDCNDAQTLYADADGDGFGSTAKVACNGVTTNTDCDDTQRLYADGDGDGFGAGAAVACGVATNTDCNDKNAAINPTVITGTPTVSGVPVCAGSPVTVTFATACPGLYTLQLSNASGSFTSPTSLGAWSSGSSVPLPATVSVGSSYRIRVVAPGGGSASNPSAAFRIRACNTRLAAETSAEDGAGLRVSVSPNPTEGRLRITINGAAGQALRVELFSGSGQMLRQQGIEQAQSEESLSWDLSRQAPGLYFLRVSSEREAKTLKVVH